jgi:hypothetical protein
MKITSLSKPLIITIFTIALLSYGFIVVNAAYPLTQWEPGETLDPTCIVGSANCSVDISTNPAGNDTYIQYNDNGDFGADSNFTWDSNLLDFFVGDAITVGGSAFAVNNSLGIIQGMSPFVEFGDINSTGNETSFRVYDMSQEILGQTTGTVSFGDVNNNANSTTFVIDDANQNITLNNNPAPGYQFQLVSDPLMYGFFPGGAMAWQNNGTGESASVSMGDFSGLGGTDVQATLAYSDLLQENSASFNVNATAAGTIFQSLSGGNNAVDTVYHQILLEGSQIYIAYDNLTGNISNDIVLNDNGISFAFNGDGYAFPLGDGTLNQVLATDGSGQLSWQTVSGGSTNPAGNNTELQFNNNGSFGADGALTFAGNVLNTPGLSINSVYTLPTVDGVLGQVLQTDGAGNISWVTPASSGNTSTATTTNYRLARELNIDYKNEDTQIVSIPEFDDPVAASSFEAGGSHGLIYIAEHDVLFSTVRNVPPGFIRFNDPDDLSDYTYVEIPGMGTYGHPDQVVYSPYTDKVYMILSNNTYVGNNIRIFEIDPVTLAYTLVIDDSIGTPVGGPTLTVLDDHLYVTQGYYTPEIHKYNLDTFANVDFLELAAETNNGLHSIETDGRYLYVATSWNSTNHTVAKIDPTTMTLVASQTFNPGTFSGLVSGVSDDILVWGQYLYLPLEMLDVGFNKILRVNKDDFSDSVYLDIDIDTTGIHSIFTDGRYIYYGGLGNTLGRFDPATNIGEVYDASSYPGSNLNEFATDGSRLFFTGFETYPVSGEGFVGRLAFFDGMVETYVLGADGNKLTVTDKVNNRFGIGVTSPAYSLDVNYDSAGVVARFTSTDGNCTINPAVVGGISCSSDETLKKDIAPIDESQLDKLNQISPVEYHWMNDDNTTEKTIGFIAQDVQAIFPELVSFDETTQKLTMSYAGLAVPLVGSVRELGLRLTSLEALSDLNLSGNTNKIIELFSDFLLTTQRIVINGLVEIRQATIDRLFARKIQTETFCIDDMCITKDEFKTILEGHDLLDRARDINVGREIPEIISEDEGEIEEETTTSEPEIVVDETEEVPQTPLQEELEPEIIIVPEQDTTPVIVDEVPTDEQNIQEQEPVEEVLTQEPQAVEEIQVLEPEPIVIPDETPQEPTI